MIIQSFQALPSLLNLYSKAVIKRNQKQLTSLPELTLKVSDFAINTGQFSRYLESFGFKENKKIPAPFFYLATQTSQLLLLTQSRFPLSPAGLVHLGVCFEQQRTLITDDWQNSQAGNYILMSIVNQRHSKKGLVFDIETEFYNQQKTLFLKITNTYLARAIKVNSHEGLPVLCDFNQVSQTAVPSFDSDITLNQHAGKRYARLSGDYNPIHLSRFTAKLFGFKRPIIHGIYLVSEAYAQLHNQQSSPPQKGVFQFKSPFYLPGQGLLTIHTQGKESSVLVHSKNQSHLHGKLEGAVE